jgi:autoinducer 2-degrading protein
MFIVHVCIQVKSENLEEFKLATLANVKNSLQEPGIARFDFLEETDDRNRFMLVEVYRTAEDAQKHKETAHYQAWRDRVAPMMETPRTNIKLANIHPADAGWTP